MTSTTFPDGIWLSAGQSYQIQARTKISLQSYSAETITYPNFNTQPPNRTGQTRTPLYLVSALVPNTINEYYKRGQGLLTLGKIHRNGIFVTDSCQSWFSAEKSATQIAILYRQLRKIIFKPGVLNLFQTWEHIHP
jgi:hypothetical protein